MSGCRETIQEVTTLDKKRDADGLEKSDYCESARIDQTGTY